MRYIKHLYKNEDFPRNSILVVLVVTAIFLGFVIYKKNHVSPPAPTIDQEQTVNMPPRLNSEAFSVDEQRLLMPPAPGASQTEIDVHSQLAAKLAVIGSKVEVKDCKADPLVLQTKFGSKVTFKNTGDYNISISFDKDNIIDVGVGKSVSTNKAFVHGEGLYGYLCQANNFTGLIGFVLLTL